MIFSILRIYLIELRPEYDAIYYNTSFFCGSSFKNDFRNEVALSKKNSLRVTKREKNLTKLLQHQIYIFKIVKTREKTSDTRFLKSKVYKQSVHFPKQNYKNVKRRVSKIVFVVVENLYTTAHQRIQDGS